MTHEEIKKKLKTKEPLRIVVMGTSVFSGQDNCYESTFKPLLQRNLNSLFKDFLKVEIQNFAQNGDGESQLAQLACLGERVDLNKVDIVINYWDMIGQTYETR